MIYVEEVTFLNTNTGINRQVTTLKVKYSIDTIYIFFDNRGD